MIPREILKKIRQIELRTNRLVSETLTNFVNRTYRLINREIHEIRERGYENLLSAYFAWFVVHSTFGK